MPNVKDIISLMQTPPSKEGTELITKAYEFAQKAHKDHKRYSEEPYFTHLVETAKTLAEFGLGPKTISAGLLHDTIEDTKTTGETIEKEFKAFALAVVPKNCAVRVSTWRWDIR
ncbi:HD domain-containing protein [Patescibacteria group bacterium]|nr:HD domain-containing protein [Patescibacteria group bacterium]